MPMDHIVPAVSAHVHAHDREPLVFVKVTATPGLRRLDERSLHPRLPSGELRCRGVEVVVVVRLRLSPRSRRRGYSHYSTGGSRSCSCTSRALGNPCSASDHAVAPVEHSITSIYAVFIVSLSFPLCSGVVVVVVPSSVSMLWPPDLRPRGPAFRRIHVSVEVVSQLAVGLLKMAVVRPLAPALALGPPLPRQKVWPIPIAPLPPSTCSSCTTACVCSPFPLSLLRLPNHGPTDAALREPIGR
mmetsp:Transcript_18494/g.46161  ORF Transcript_18494/g.46161 Transcript_18494/m.46161 type:complete len:243 (+) Transcript_18494:82-810(+)